MASETAQAILEEFRQQLNDLNSAHAFALIGLREIPKLFSASKSPSNPDPYIYIGVRPPGAGPPPYARWRLSQALDQIREGGPAETRLGQQWIAFLYALWEHEYRPRLAAAHGRDPTDEKYPLLGDLRLLRNDVLHHHGIATAANTGRCEIIHWFQPGDIIQLTGQHFDEFSQLFPWSEMQSTPDPSSLDRGEQTT